MPKEIQAAIITTRHLSHSELDYVCEASAQTPVSKYREVIARNGCRATLIFCEKENPYIRRELAELLLRSFQKRSEAT